MFIKVLFYIYFVLFYFLIAFVMNYNWLGILQFNGYCLKIFFRNRLVFLKNNFYIIVLSFILFLICAFLNVLNNIYCGILYLFLWALSLSIFYIKQFKYNLVKFTKRIIRLCLPILLLHIVVLFFLFYFLNLLILSRLWIVLIASNMGVFLLAFLITIPIEKLIAKRYIKLAKNKLRQNKKLIKIGITGSYGKTSVKEILSKILIEQYNVLFTPKSYNTPMGITKTINESLTNSTEIFVCEMGAKKVGEILELCDIVEINMGIITAIGDQHTETFGNIENIYRTKKELADYLYGKLCVFNLMNRYTSKMYHDYSGKKVGCFVLLKRDFLNCRRLKKNVKCFLLKDRSINHIYYEFPKKNNYYAKVKKITQSGSIFNVYCGNLFLGEVCSKLLGVHNIINIVLALSMAMHLGVNFHKVKRAIESIDSISARLEKFVTNNGAIVINNGYNSNINSVSSSLSVLKLFENKNKVVITPGIIETNDDFKHNREFGKIVSKFADEVIIVKEKNKDAILLGLSDNCFDMSKVYVVNDFADAKGIIDIAGEGFVFLIENDLPNYYK